MKQDTTRTRTRRLGASLVAALAVMLAPAVASAIPSVVTVQGYLTTDAGLPADGSFALKLTLYDAASAGTELWTETQVGVPVINGLFDAQLGADTVGNPLMLSVFRDNASVWFAIKVEAGPGIPGGGEAELPRSPMTSVGFAFAAQYAENAGSAMTALDVTCTACISESELDFQVVTGSELAAALAALPTVTSVDGLAGGNITSAVTVTGSVSATSFVQGGNVVCDASGNCGTALWNLGCAEGEVPVYEGGAWICGSGGGDEPPDCEGRYMGLQYNATTGWACVDLLSTGPSGGEAKGGETKDAWGFVWDTDERQASTWAAANQDCLDDGGRLPTISELWRAGGGWKNEIGNSYTTNYLWSRTWWSKTNKGRVRLNDGAITNTAATSSAPYRCVWPETRNHFANSYCMGEPGDECWDHVAFAAGKMNMDKYERPAVSYVAATDECGFYHAHLANQLDYAENAINGLPNGTNNWQWTADHHRYDIVSIVRWTGVDTAYDDWDDPAQSWSGRTGGPYKFRCIGVGYDAGAHPTTIANEFVASTTYVKATNAATTKATFADSIDGCFTQGGHMAHSRDIMEAVRAGLGNGPGTGGADYIWIADRSRYERTQIARWGGVDTSFTSHHSEYFTWATVNNSTLYEHRCAFYPIDADHELPEPSDCTSGVPCTTFSNGATNWAVDTFDRAASTYLEAVQGCLDVGARLPSAHQLTEAIRAGLPNGFQLNLWTSDSSGNDSNAASYATVLNWNGTDTAFSPIYSARATWSAKGGTTNNYRCIWTNELF